MNLDVIKSELNEGQKKVFDLFFSGRNFLLTGPAGTGKSYVMKKLFEYLEYHSYPFGKTASTGTAAVNIGGSTIFSFMGIGLGEGTKEWVYAQVTKNKKAMSRIRGCKALFIDEISMLKASTLDKINYVFERVRGRKPQLIFVGDFLQLPPVFKMEEQDGFAFESALWKKEKFQVLELTELVRQDETTQFAKLLQEIRVGETGNLDILKGRINKKFSDGIGAVKLYCKNINVDAENNRRLQLIQQPSFYFNSIDAGEKHHIDFFDKNCPAPKRLELKIGAQVMLLKNLDLEQELFNGSVGFVTSITTAGVEVQFKKCKTLLNREAWEIKDQAFNKEGKLVLRVIASRSQVPLKLAWATTVHKSQGATLDHAEIDISEAFESGQAYTALSRVRNLESLSLKPFTANKIRVNKKALDFYKKMV